MNILTREPWPGYWTAIDDDSYDGVAIGTGDTEDEAIEDLKSQIGVCLEEPA